MEYEDKTEVIKLSLNSRFEGNMAMHFLYQILKAAATIASASLLYPLSVFLYERYLCQNSYIEGRQLKFVGKLVKVYVIYLSGMVFAAVSIFAINYLISHIPWLVENKIIEWATNAVIAGMNTVFITARVRKWKKANTVYQGSDDYENSYLDSNFVKLAIISAISAILGALSFGLALPYIKKLKAQYFVNQTTVCKEKLFFTGKAVELYKKLPLWILLIVITIGGYILYINYYLEVWTAKNTIIKKHEN